MAGPATLKDVAAAANVSVSTASRVLRGDLGLVGVETAARVRDVASALNYHPSSAAQALVQGRTRTVGIAYQYPHLAHFTPMLSLAADIVREYGYRLSHFPLHYAEHMEADAALTVRERRVDILVLARVPGAEHALDWVAADYQQVVAIDASGIEDPQLPILSAAWDDTEGIRMAVEYLASLGHRRLLFLASFDPIKSGAFTRAVEATDGEASFAGTTSTLGHGLMAEGARLMREVLALRERPTAVLARNDEFAIGALHAALEAGLTVPDDISIMGYYDVPASAFTAPSLTTVATPFCECLEAVLRPALEAACNESGERPPRGRAYFSPHLVIRKSTGPVPDQSR